MSETLVVWTECEHGEIEYHKSKPCEACRSSETAYELHEDTAEYCSGGRRLVLTRPDYDAAGAVLAEAIGAIDSRSFSRAAFLAGRVVDAAGDLWQVEYQNDREVG